MGNVRFLLMVNNLGLLQTSTDRKHVVISGGDGLEDITEVDHEQVLGQCDSSNFLQIWQT